MKYGKYGRKSPALSLIEKFFPGRERILEMWPFILIAICSVGCISLTAPASTSLWILAPFSKEPSAPDWEQQCHKMGAWICTSRINCLYQCMTSLSQLEVWKMPIVYGSKCVKPFRHNWFNWSSNYNTLICPITFPLVIWFDFKIFWDFESFTKQYWVFSWCQNLPLLRHKESWNWH